jgi:hypothetical protein
MGDGGAGNNESGEMVTFGVVGAGGGASTAIGRSGDNQAKQPRAVGRQSALRFAPGSPGTGVLGAIRAQIQAPRPALSSPTPNPLLFPQQEPARAAAKGAGDNSTEAYRPYRGPVTLRAGWAYTLRAAAVGPDGLPGPAAEGQFVAVECGGSGSGEGDGGGAAAAGGEGECAKVQVMALMGVLSQPLPLPLLSCPSSSRPSSYSASSVLLAQGLGEK